MSLANDGPRQQSAIIQDSGGQLCVTDRASICPLQPRNLLVRTKAVALNPYDYKLPSHFPAPGTTGGSDFVGTIVAITSEASKARPDLSVGDLVCGCVYCWNSETPDIGSFAQYVEADAQLVYKLNDNLHFKIEEAATLGAGFATLCLALWHTDALELSGTPETPLEIAGSSKPAYVFVYGGSTASGTMALQLLRLSGYTPIATCSPRNFALVKSYGAEHVFDYTHPETPSTIRKLTNNRLEYALDCITDRDSTQICHEVIGRAGGRLATLEVPPDPKAGEKRRQAVKHSFVDGHEVFGQGVLIPDPKYKRAPNPEKYLFAVKKVEMFQRLINEGKLRSHPIQLVDGGLEGVLEGLRMLKDGVSGKKLVVFIER